MQANGFLQLVADGVEGGQGAHGFLEHQADVAAADAAHFTTVGGKGGQVDGGAIRATQHDLAADDTTGAFDDAQDGLGGDAFAAAGFADDAQRAPRVQIERCPVNRSDCAFIGEKPGVQITDTQDGISHRGPPRL